MFFGRFFRLNKVVSLILALAAFMSLMPIGAFAVQSGNVVLVGANPDFGISDFSGEYGGYAFDYLKQMRNTTGHRYTYVEGTSDELFSMLANGEIEVIPCVSKNDFKQLAAAYIERSGDENAQEKVDALEFSNISLMMKYSAIYVSKSGSGRDIGYYDTEKINHLKIGYLKEDASKYFQNGRFICSEVESAEYVTYNTESQLRQDYESGKIDAVVKECYRTWPNESIIYQFATEECYFLYAQGEARLKAQIDEAIGRLYVSSSRIPSELYDKHLSKYGVQAYAFSEDEKDYIKTKKTVVVAYNESSSFMNNYDLSEADITTPIDSVIAQIQDYTGLDLQIIGCENLNECIALLDAGTADMICGGVNHEGIAQFGSYRVSAAYSSVPIVYAGKKSTVLGDRMRVALVSSCDDINQYLKAVYPNSTVIFYSTTAECLRAVRSGEADAAAGGAYELLSLLDGGDFDDLQILSVSPAFHTESFAYSQNTAVNLITIMGKALSRMTDNEAVVDSYKLASGQIVRSHIENVMEQYFWVIIGIAALMLVCVAVLMLTVFMRNKRSSQIDSLTGGRNKAKFLEDVRRAVRRSGAENWAMVLFDINKFKYVNDRFGYEEGNRMLQRIFTTLIDNLGDDEIGARISEDNFACVIHNAADNDILSKINTVFAEFERRNSLFVNYPIVFSAGVCRLGQCAEGGGEPDLNAAIDRCKIARRTIKEHHRSSIAFYDGKIREKALREKDFENLMPKALAEHEFLCYIQPKYGLKSRRIEGGEALIRWNSKSSGFIYPDEFIPISEKNGFVVELDFFILEQVCRQMRSWLDNGIKPVVISVNQSRLHLNHDDYIWRLREIVDKYDIPYEYIELELTESVFIEKSEKLLAVMQKLHEIGFKLSLDDFGSGYSSLNMLKDIPVDVVKIDREFFNGTVNSKKGRAVISTVVDLAKNLNMEVISEGVETLEQVEFLAEIHCAMVQGYYFAKPMCIEDFEKLWFEELRRVSECENTQGINPEQ